MTAAAAAAPRPVFGRSEQPSRARSIKRRPAEAPRHRPDHHVVAEAAAHTPQTSLKPGRMRAAVSMNVVCLAVTPSTRTGVRLRDRPVTVEIVRVQKRDY